MRTTYDSATVRLYHLDDASEGGAATTLCYGPLAEALQMAAQQPEEVQSGLFIVTDNDVVAYLDLIGNSAAMLRRLLVLAALVATPAAARDALGVYGQWGAFRDAPAARCYAIAMAAPSALKREFQPFATVAWRPRQQVRGQVHFRLSRQVRPGATLSVSIAGQRIALVGGGADAWAADKRGDAAIIAAMRSAREMTVFARDGSGRGFSNSYMLEGAATAMDAAALGCAQLR